MARSYFRALWLEPALESDPFVKARLIKRAGWELAGRPNDGSRSFVPTGIVDHHTACMLKVGHDPQSCINGIMAGNSQAPGPISQLLGTFTPPGVKWTGRNVSPRLVILASGYANHAGTGTYPWGAPTGNAYSIGTEWCGPPEDGWPDEVIELRARADAAILRYNGWSLDHECQHFEYATPRGRKIDTSGAWSRQPNLSQLGTWNGDLFRDEIGKYMVLEPPKPEPAPEPLPPLLEDKLATARITVEGRNAQFYGTGTLLVDPATGRKDVHCVMVTWSGPGNESFHQDHSAAPDTVHQHYTPETLKRDLVLVGDPSVIQDDKHTWSAADFFRVA